MLKNIKKYIPKRKYRERGQLERRKKLGFLEKKQDYKIRAEDYHQKESRYKKLKEAARTKNPDEFYHKMIKAKIIDGEHLSNGERKTPEEKVVLNNRFINLVNFKRSKLEKEKEKLLVDLQLSAGALFNEKPKHTLFYDNEEEAIQDQFLNKKTNREERRIEDKDQEEGEGTNEQIDHESLLFNSKGLISNYKQKERSLNDLSTIYKGLTEQKELIIPGRRKKMKEGQFKYFVERKR